LEFTLELEYHNFVIFWCVWTEMVEKWTEMTFLFSLTFSVLMFYEIYI